MTQAWRKSVEPFLRYSAKTLENVLLFQMSHFDDVKNQHDSDVINIFGQFVKISTHSISLPSFIII